MHYTVLKGCVNYSNRGWGIIYKYIHIYAEVTPAMDVMGMINFKKNKYWIICLVLSEL